ncbi:MAG: hypothetical protein F4X68_10695 [Acidimicrobiia bacterium]|nr:hypothetical protein [Acidimicrobiia bacterium]MYB74413.1 hypothetical protein [Acidimicrobiia bacterium]
MTGAVGLGPAYSGAPALAGVRLLRYRPQYPRPKYGQTFVHDVWMVAGALRSRSEPITPTAVAQRLGCSPAQALAGLEELVNG